MTRTMSSLRGSRYPILLMYSKAASMFLLPVCFSARTAISCEAHTWTDLFKSNQEWFDQEVKKKNLSRQSGPAFHFQTHKKISFKETYTNTQQTKIHKQADDLPWKMSLNIKENTLIKGSVGDQAPASSVLRVTYHWLPVLVTTTHKNMPPKRG